MGYTYSFEKAKREEMLKGRCHFKEIIGDINNKCFLMKMVACPREQIDPDVVAYFKKHPDGSVVVTRETVSSALSVLVDLDKRVFAMPFKMGLTSIRLKAYHEDRGYCEDKPKERGYESGYEYFGPCKENVDILKEVEKIYGYRHYHYGFPWEQNPCGSKYVQDCLRTVLADMDADKDGEYVYIFSWI